MTRVVSFVLWGSNEVYNYGLLENIRFVQQHMRDFEVWVYCTKDILEITRKTCLETPLVRLIEREGKPGFFCTAWRFEPMFEEGVEVCISRDTDSRITLRELTWIRDWLNRPGKEFHVFRDDPGHRSPIMAGMCGSRGPIIRNLKTPFFDYFQNSLRYGIDEEALKNIIYPAILPSLIVYRGRNAPILPGETCVQEIPDPAPGEPFIGQVVKRIDGREYSRVRKNTFVTSELILKAAIAGVIVLLTIMIFRMYPRGWGKWSVAREGGRKEKNN